MSGTQALVGLHGPWRRAPCPCRPWWLSALPDVGPPHSSLCRWGHVGPCSSVCLRCPSAFLRRTLVTQCRAPRVIQGDPATQNHGRPAKTLVPSTVPFPGPVPRFRAREHAQVPWVVVEATTAAPGFCAFVVWLLFLV